MKVRLKISDLTLELSKHFICNLIGKKTNHKKSTLPLQYLFLEIHNSNLLLGKTYTPNVGHSTKHLVKTPQNIQS